jgi:hypothetical protein
METKITDMDKDELVLYMKASREILRFDDELKSWQRAIKLYKDAGNKFDSECTGCRRRLLEWLGV